MAEKLQRKIKYHLGDLGVDQEIKVKQILGK
jgi:hypothetical protein